MRGCPEIGAVFPPFFEEPRRMDQTYDAHGIRFRYPSHWELSEEQVDNEISITVASGETSFWSIILFLDGLRPEELIESALSVFRDEYDDIDDYEVEAEICNRRCVARDIEFVCMELINSAFLRSFKTEPFSVLVLYQGTDHELKQTKSFLEGISASIEFAEDAGDFS